MFRRKETTFYRYSLRPSMRLCIGIGWALLLLVGIPKLQAREAPNDHKNLRPEEVLVIANKASADSMAVAQHYMEKRHIPEENLFTLWFPKHKHRRPISHREFQEKIVAPLQTFLEKRGLKEKILALVTVYDVPYKVAGPSPLVPQLKKKIARKETSLKTLLSDPDAKAKKIRRLRKQIEALKMELKTLEPVWATLLSRLPPGTKKHAKGLLANHAAVDSELAWLFRADVYGSSVMETQRLKAYFGRSRNPYFSQGLKFREFRKRAKAGGLQEKRGLFYLTARLEGPTVAISKKLVDSALQAEFEGPRGIGCFDARRGTIGQTKAGYALGEAWVRRAYIETRNAGFQAKFDEKKTLFQKGACPDTLFYWGWYALQNYQDAFQSRFSSGALAVHTASGEASNIRRFEKGGKIPWCAGLLAHGAAFCSGPISEPFLDAFPHADLFYPRIFRGWSAGEAYWAAQAYSSWMMVMIGDPLYAPFAGKNHLKHYVNGRIDFTETGGKSNVAMLSKNKQYDVVLFLKARRRIFKSPDRYRVTGFKTSHSKSFKLSGFERPSFEVSDQNTFLAVRGMQFELDDFSGSKTGELEVRIDLGPDGGEKMISQQFRLR